MDKETAYRAAYIITQLDKLDSFDKWFEEKSTGGKTVELRVKYDNSIFATRELPEEIRDNMHRIIENIKLDLEKELEAL